MTKIGKVLEQEIAKKGYTQQEVADVLKIRQSSVYKIYNKSDLMVKRLVQICKLFGISVTDTIEKSEL